MSIRWIAWAMLTSGMAFSTDGLESARPWAVYYSNEAPLQEFEPYGLLVLDSQYHPPLEPLQERGKVVLGYISLGEVNRERPFYSQVRQEEMLFHENPYWEGSFFVDLRDRRWTQRVIEVLIPDILRRGFDGLFLDTLDNAAHLERSDPRRFAGMTQAAAELVGAIRYHYPDIPIMLNRAYEILPQVAADIDLLLGESVRSDYDFEKKRYQKVPQELYRKQVDILRNARSLNPRLEVFTLDYWEIEDRQGMAEIYRQQLANGFHPYVAGVKLDKLVPPDPSWLKKGGGEAQ